MNAEEQRQKRRSDKIRRPEPEEWKQTDDAAEQKQQRRRKTCEKPTRGFNNDHGINGCHRQPQNQKIKDPANTRSVVENHEATNCQPAGDHSTAKRRKCSSDSHGSNEKEISHGRV